MDRPEQTTSVTVHRAIRLANLRHDISEVPFHRAFLGSTEVRSSRRGYRSGSVRSERSAFGYGKRNNSQPRALSLSFSFSFGAASARTSPSRVDAAAAPPLKSQSRPVNLPFQKTAQSKDGDFGERSFERLTGSGQMV